MTLRRRVAIASFAAIVAVVASVVVLLLQFAASTSISASIHNQLSPAVDATAALITAQSNATGDLSDYIMLSRDASLNGYRSNIAEARRLLDSIESELPDDDAELAQLLTDARRSQAAWVENDAQPCVDLMDQGRRTAAMKKTNTKAAWDSYDQMVAASAALHHAVTEQRQTTADRLQGIAQVLGITLLLFGILVVVGVIITVRGLQVWVLAPLTRLRRDLKQATSGTHETPIEDVGPPEIRAVSIDAEQMRRDLVHEIDEARAAREGLVQDAPLVAAMQSELLPPTAAEIEGLRVHGTVHSAEGVIAGDWWDCVPRPDGTTAVVIADVSGHGVECGITALRVQSILRAALAAGLAPEVAFRAAAHSCSKDTHFVTALVMVLDSHAGSLTWCNAGHPAAVVVTADKDVHECGPTGPLLSGLGGDWHAESMSFDPGSVVVAFTDGLVESRDSQEELDTVYVSQFIRGLDAPVREEPREVIARLVAHVRNHMSDWHSDDVTLVAAARPR